MRRLLSLAFVSALAITPAFADSHSEAKAGMQASVKVSIKADVNAKAQAQAAAGDAAYAAGNFEAALVAYGEGFAQTRDAAFIYAMAQCRKSLKQADEAKAMFNMYLAAKGNATLKYKADAEAELGAKASGAVSAVGGALKTAKNATIKVVDVGSGVYAATKVTISASVNATAKASAKAGDEAYAAAKYEDAAKSYLEAYAASQQSVALYAAAQAKAQAGAGAEARALLLGYLAASPNGAQAKDAKTLLLAVGGNAKWATKVSVGAKASADVKAQAQAGDKAFAAGKFIDAAKAYGEASAKKSEAAIIYAKGVAQLYAGQTAAAAESLKAAIAAGLDAQLKVSAEAHLKASGST